MTSSATAELRKLVQTNAVKLDRILQAITQLQKKVQHMSDDQTRLDADVDQLDSEIKAEIAALQAQHPAIDFTKLEALVAANAPAAPPATPPTSTPANPGPGGTSPAKHK